MNRGDFQVMSDARLEEARALLAAGHPSGAYYLAGYAVECALKAAIAKQTREFDFPPDRKVVESVYTHNLEKLLVAAGLEIEWKEARQDDPDLEENWTIVVKWKESSRYQPWSAGDARELIAAIDDPVHGVLSWLAGRY